ncbi:MAG TPA: GAF domain-containing protein, partial [Chloroflexaceae bacterium]|nr:GAF domain-containing protein [Chloroflexaceae bacterium]
MAQGGRLLSMKQACHYLGVSRMTLIEAEERGLIVPERTVGGHRRYSLEALQALSKATRSRYEERAPAAQAPGAPQLTQFIAQLQEGARAPGSALKEALRNLVLLLELEMGAVYLRDDAGGLRLQVAYGIPHWFLEAMAALGPASLAAEVLRTRQPLVYDGRAGHGLPAQLEIGQGLCAPLIYQDEVLGCVHVLTRRRHQLFPAQISIVTTIAVFIAGLVANARLIEQVRTRLRELELLTQLSQALETTAELEPLLEIFLDAALRLVGEQFGTIHLTDESGRFLYLKTARSSPEWLYDMPVRTDAGIIAWMMRHQQPYYSPCLRDDPLLPPEFVEGVSALASVSCLCLPMRAGDQIVGVLAINTAQQRAFTPDEVRVLLTASSEAAVVIHRARLLTAARGSAEHQRRLQEAQALLLEGLATGVAVVGEAGRGVLWNRALERLSGGARERVIRPVGRRLADSDLVRAWIGECAAEIQAARLMVLHAAWRIERAGARAARDDVSMIKFYVAG